MDNSTKHLDDRWFSEYSENCTFSEINFLRPDKSNYQEEKDKFLEGKVDQPTFSYDLNKSEISRKKDLLNDLRRKIEVEEENAVVKDVYIQTIDEKLKILELLGATIDKNDVLFTRISESIYGKPDENLYKKALGILKGIVEKHNIRCSDSFLKIISDASTAIPFDFYPTSKSGVVSADELKCIFTKKIEELGFGFEVEITRNVASVTVKYSPKKKILIPEEKTWNQNIAEGLVAHEIDVHLQRFENGGQSPLSLLATGLFGYLKGEEGLAMYMELEKNKSKLPGIYNYLVPSLMYGLHSTGPLDFRQVFDFVYEYNFIISRLTGEELTGNKLKSRAWEGVWRSVRGTTGQSAGTCLTRDIIYFRGFSEIKTLVEDGNFNPQRLFVGKYDPANQVHLDILERLGV